MHETTAMPAASGRAASLAMMAERRKVRRRWLQLSPITVLYLLGLVVPYLYLFRMSFNKYDPLLIFQEMVTPRNYVKILTDDFYLSIIFSTLGLGLAVTAFTLILGYPIAWKITRSSPALKSLLLAIVLSPLLVNLVVRTYAWLVVLGDKGVINEWFLWLGWIDQSLPLSNNFWTVVIGLGHVTLPFMVLSLSSVMENMNVELFEAAESLGGDRFRIFKDILWPLCLPGVGAGSILVFSFSISAFVTPSLLGGGRVSTVSTLIYEHFTQSLNWPLGSALVFVLLTMNFCVIVLHARLFRHAM